MKFALIILILLGIASIAGVVFGEFFPANVPGGENYYLTRMGELKFRILKILGVFNPYYSIWYISLLALLSFSMTVCTIKRFKSLVNLAFSKGIKSSKEEISRLSNSKNFRIKSNKNETGKKLQILFKKKFFQTRTDEINGKTLIFAQRGGISHLGIILLHLGMVILVIGGLLTTLFGYSTYEWGKPGDIITVKDRDFQIRVDDFQVLLNLRQFFQALY